MITEAERFSTDRPDLCDCLRWKGQFILSAPDPHVQPSNDGLFWCLFTQKCLGPDGKLAEPGTCSSPDRKCYGTGQV